MVTNAQSVDSDILRDNSGSVAGLKENGLILMPVPDYATGEGAPYAPVDWPNPGDVWRWKVGKRKTISGFMSDRYLYPPLRLRKNLSKKNPAFASMQSVKEFVQREFPNADHDAFAASFSWKIPAKGYCSGKDLSFERSGSELQPSGTELPSDMKCKARNKMCILELETEGSSLPVMDCDMCCSESGFCYGCCCILCSRSLDCAYGGYSFIRCKTTMSKINVCGHAAHIDCALRSYMAGTVGGSIRLDVEYFCRRCDKRTDLISHVTLLLKTCESLDSRDDIKKILQMGLCILRGSQRDIAKRLHNRIELVLTKLGSGSHLIDIWNVEENTTTVSSGAIPHLRNNKPNKKKGKSEQVVYTTYENQIGSFKLKEEIDQVLEDLKRSQEFEYRMAEDKLNAQKELLIALDKKLGDENQIEQELARFKEMEEIAKGFGRTSSSILNEYFGLQIRD